MTKQTKSIAVIITGYKEKNLRPLVDLIKANATEHYVHFNIFDQHAIDHREDFSDIEDYCSYEFKVWDSIIGQCPARGRKINDMMNMDYILVLSPDISLGVGWDKTLVDFCEQNESVIISGAGLPTIERPNLFDLVPKWDHSDDFSQTNLIDRNIIFGNTEAFGKIRYPEFLKYKGEQEYLSIAFLSAGYRIFSMPSSLVVADTQERSIETKYCIWSKEHNYNIVVDIMHGIDLPKYKITQHGVDQFLNSYNLSIDSIKRLPYQTNDVSYDPSTINIHDVDARRFITGLKAIH